MIHGDNKGLVLPPRVAQTQVVLVPIVYKEDDPASINNKLEEIYKQFKEAGVRTFYDDRDNYNPGWKFNHWEVKGVPIRIELGKKDFENQEVRVVRRDTGAKQQMKWDQLATGIPHLLEEIQGDMYRKAEKERDEHIKETENWEQFMDCLNQKNLCLAPWCEDSECEIKAKDRSKEESLKLIEQAGEEEEVLTGAAKTLCIPFDQTPLKEGAKCFHCGKDAKTKALWGRSY